MGEIYFLKSYKKKTINKLKDAKNAESNLSL